MQGVTRWALGLSVGWLAGFAGAEPGRATDPVVSAQTENDWRDTERARAAIVGDPQLARHNLGVRVDHGVATIWGPVADRSIVERTSERLRSVAGLRTIIDATHLAREDDADLREPARARPKLPGLPEPIITTPIPEPEITTLSLRRASNESVSILKPVDDRIVVENRRAITLLTPVAMHEAAANDRGPVQALLAVDARFSGIRFDIQNGVVTLTGTIQRWDDLWQCAESVSRLPGVNRVVIGRITKQ